MLKVGDHVQTETGAKGKIVTLTKDGESAYVQIHDDKPGVGVILLRLDSLTKIEVGKNN